MPHRGRLGIIGFGIVGRSYLTYLEKNPTSSSSIIVVDKNAVDLQGQPARFVQQTATNLAPILASCDQLFVSPGVDMRSYFEHHNKIQCEVDLFSRHWRKPILAVTGTIGKTSTTHLLGELVSLHEQTGVGGNIGVPMLSLLDTLAASAVLELSSFQLEYARDFAPTVALWTNFFPNHLDRHRTMDEYFDAKLNQFAHQGKGQQALFTARMLSALSSHQLKKLSRLTSQVWLISDTGSDALTSYLHLFDTPRVITRYAHELREVRGATHDVIFDLRLLPAQGFMSNWVYALSALYAYTNTLTWLSEYLVDEGARAALGKKLLQPHRLEHFAQLDDSDFYNDSKATVPQATLEAVRELSGNNRPIIVIVGGLSKGVDRRQMYRTLSENQQIKKVFYLGMTPPSHLANDSFSSLSGLVSAIFASVEPGDQVLFSPSGASFDLFSDYRERGNRFKEMVMQHHDKSKRTN